MRVDEKTKEVLQEWPLEQVRRWAASPKTFTLVSFTSLFVCKPKLNIFIFFLILAD